MRKAEGVEDVDVDRLTRGMFMAEMEDMSFGWKISLFWGCGEGCGRGCGRAWDRRNEGSLLGGFKSKAVRIPLKEDPLRVWMTMGWLYVCQRGGGKDGSGP